MSSEKSKDLKESKPRKEEKAASNKRSIRLFLIKYFILANVFFFLYMFRPIVKLINIGKVYNDLLVRAASKVLNIAGFECSRRGFIIALPTLALDVRFGCNGLEAVMIYFIAVIAYPAKWKRKIIGLIAGFFIIQIANFLRIIMLVYAGLHFRKFFDYIHIYIAQGVMIALALGVFFTYLNYANSARKAHA